MSNKFFHLALSAIAPLAVISTIAFSTPAVAIPGTQPTQPTKTITVNPDPVTPSAVNSNTTSNNASTHCANNASNTSNSSSDRSAKAANSQTNPAVSRGTIITLTISPEALIIAIITVMFIVGAVSHRKHKRQRVLTLQEQIQLLEKIWRMTPQR